MLVSDFDYDLPAELMAQRPMEVRDAARMMVLNRQEGSIEDRVFRDLPQALRPGDLLVLNNTRVFPARLLGRRKGVRAQHIGKNNPRAREFLKAEIELLLCRRDTEDIWQGLVRPGRKVRTGEVLVFGENELEAEVLDRGDYGQRRVRLRARSGTAQDALERLGHIPLPPYLSRSDDASDRDAYQTVYARETGAVAAPTAGLHFTQRTFHELHARGVETCEITLHVGPGTFRPVHAERVEDHVMESEWYRIAPEAAAAIERAQRDGRRVIATGTTCTRVLEHAAKLGEGTIAASQGETNLFIAPGFRFQAVKALLTNFHLPRSTLLMLVSAFAGHEFTLRAYRHAVEQRYRFYSYGDCMLIV
jgi:S-adenosylmethionine:tRNA ribosyltransferase-isomerase